MEAPNVTPKTAYVDEEFSEQNHQYQLFALPLKQLQRQ
jgi:hypothetical protein